MQRLFSSASQKSSARRQRSDLAATRTWRSAARRREPMLGQPRSSASEAARPAMTKPVLSGYSASSGCVLQRAVAGQMQRLVGRLRVAAPGCASESPCSREPPRIRVNKGNPTREPERSHSKGGATWHARSTTTSRAFERTSKRRKGFPERNPREAWRANRARLRGADGEAGQGGSLPVRLRASLSSAAA